MKWNNPLVLIGAGIVIGLLIGAKSWCGGETTIMVHDTTNIAPESGRIAATAATVQPLNGVTVHEWLTRHGLKLVNPEEMDSILAEGDAIQLGLVDSLIGLQRAIDSILHANDLKELTVCGDTVNVDSFHVCWNYGTRDFTYRIGFVPRAHDTVVVVNRGGVQSGEVLFSWHPVAGVEWNQGYAAIGGVTASLWKLEGAALLSVGLTKVEPRASVMIRF